MRIGIDATTIYTSRPTGLGVYSINIINEMAKLHNDIVVWTVDDSLLTLDKSRIRHVMRPLRFLGDELFQLRPLWVESMLPRRIREEKVDVLYSTIPNGLLRSPVPHVLTVHDLIPVTYPADAPRSVKWNFRHRLPKIFSAATKIVAVSEFTRHDLLQYYNLDPAKVAVVSEGFDRLQFHPPDDPSRLSHYGLSAGEYLLYVGNASERKNLLRLVRAFAAICDRVPHRLVLAGAKSAEAVCRLREVIAATGTEGRVVLLDYVPYHDLSQLYAGASAFVFVSEYEGFGLPVLEAMACGVPVIAASSTSLPEVTGEAALLVDPTDIDGISAAILKLLTSPGLRHELSSRGRVRSELFSWEQSARQIVDLLHEAYANS